jgi:hypothetical protein
VTKQTRRARAGQPMTADPYALHRVDSAYLEGSHARMVAGKYEHKPLPIDVAKPDSETGYDLNGKNYPDDEDAGIGWFVVAILFIVCFAAYGTYINFK